MARIGKPYNWALFILLMISHAAFAGVVTGELDTSSGSLDDQFVYTLTVQGSLDGDPEFPKVDGLDVRNAGTSQSMSIINGKMSREVQFQYAILPQKAGTFTIPAIKVKVDGKDSETLPLELKVSASGNPRSSANSGGGAAADQDNGNVSGIFVERSFSKTTAYVGEAIGVKFKVYSRVKVAGANTDIHYPTSFQVKNVEGQKSYRETVNGQEYDVTELNSVLIANRDGEFTIDPAMLMARVAVARRSRPRGFFDDFLGMTDLQEKRLRTAPAVLKILPLPTAGRRKDFSGLIGEFKISGDLSPRSGNTGDTMNLRLTIDGVGSASGMLEPNLPFESKLAKVYKDKPEYKEVIDGDHGVESQKTFKYAIVPTQPGQHALGTVNVQTFNPTLGAYQDLKFDLGTLEVTGAAVAQAPVAARSANPTAADNPGAKESAPKPEQKSVEVKARDLVEPHSLEEMRGSDTLTSQDWTNGGTLLALSLLVIISSSVFALRRRPEGDSARIQRANKAFKHSQKHLDFAHQCLRKQNLADALRAAQTCFKDYTGAKFGVVGSAVTLRDMETYLRSRSVSRETLLELREVWSALDQMIYAPPLGQNPTRGEELLQKSRRVLEQMERQCGRS